MIKTFFGRTLMIHPHSITQTDIISWNLYLIQLVKLFILIINWSAKLQILFFMCEISGLAKAISHHIPMSTYRNKWLLHVIIPTHPKLIVRVRWSWTSFQITGFWFGLWSLSPYWASKYFNSCSEIVTQRERQTLCSMCRSARPYLMLSPESDIQQPNSTQ